MRKATALAILAGMVLAPLARAGSPPSVMPAGIAAANRQTWGVSLSALSPGPGRDPLFLTGNPPLPPVAQAQIDAMTISRRSMQDLVIEVDMQNRADKDITDPAQREAAKRAHQQALNELAREAATRSILRDLYSPAQLQEQMTWFWLNQFNVHAQKRDIRAMVGDYEDTIRAHALGHFRDLLEATLHHPAMLRYLDNDQNAVGHINENYAREIMELHTMGVGSGYTQKDVQELARILTGVGVSLRPDAPRLRPEYQGLYLRRGLFEFNPNRHDFGDKRFLGTPIRGEGFGEVEKALDLIAASPATARHLSTRIATYFLGEAPPPALVERMAQAWQTSRGDIPAVLRVLFAAPEYRASLGHAFKDPMHYVISAVRYAYDGADSGTGGPRVILNADPILNWLNRMGEGLYGHETPDGYPLEAGAWTGPGQMETRFEIARTIGNGAAGLFRPRGQGMAEQPAFPQVQNALWYEGLSHSYSAQTRGVLDQAASPQQWNTLFLASPEFMRR